ncbi:MAG: hypothetical protein ACNS62_19500 [Candidatus Cyclobacteriaceae bacterium M3_2C_046]
MADDKEKKKVETPDPPQRKEPVPDKHNVEGKEKDQNDQSSDKDD